MIAQNKIEEGVVISTQKMSSPNPEVAAQLAMVGDVVTTTQFKKGKMHTQVNSIMMGNNTTIMDSDAKKMLVLSESMNGKTYVMKDIDPNEEEVDKFDITKGDETKTILGYECQEYNVAVNEGGVKMNMTVFTTDKIKAQNEQLNKMGSKLEGYPMYMKIEMNQGGMDMIIESEVTKVEAKPIKDEVFSLKIPEGYTNAQAAMEEGK
ncbi:hypothetical protein C7H52_01180 [Aurantibacter aestuarii]|uniref:Uncharacterized protein n=2 Tax=Aurantibacter aestuarii TaxID=1266046 RepID=A0A2T1NGC8_9FLAO|nr:hypothetical protein C7H52_01180 [Aurantibacter aestuarii]